MTESRTRLKEADVTIGLDLEVLFNMNKYLEVTTPDGLFSNSVEVELDKDDPDIMRIYFQTDLGQISLTMTHATWANLAYARLQEKRKHRVDKLVKRGAADADRSS